jgi:hypothetical protein
MCACVRILTWINRTSPPKAPIENQLVDGFDIGSRSPDARSRIAIFRNSVSEGSKADVTQTSADDAFDPRRVFTLLRDGE